METIRALVLSGTEEGRRTDLDLRLARLSSIDVIGECAGREDVLSLAHELDADVVLVEAERLPELLGPADAGPPSPVPVAAHGNGSSRRNGSRFVVKRPNGRIRLVPVHELMWVEAARDYVRLHTAAESHLVRETMATIEARLDRQEFVRIHRSTIVRIEAIVEIKYEPSGRCSVQLADGSQRPASRSGRRRLEGAIGYSA